ncbi:MAG: nuclear transport factor 2 family protein [Myxococcota bacterium]|nr:nuclear transport factor 2 family protein [Myxococcota bacterium]
MTSTNEDPMAAVERLIRVTNAHDIDGVVSCFADDYVLDAPVHPRRSFRGNEQVRRNWTQIFGAVPDIAVRVVRSTRDGNAAWTEWEMTGTRRDGVQHLMRGVFIFGVNDGLMRWGRMFLEPVDEEAGDTPQWSIVK